MNYYRISFKPCSFIILLLCVFTLKASTQSKFTLSNHELLLPSEISFEAGSDKLKLSSENALKHIKLYLEEKTYITAIRIEVHTDNVGDESMNLLLSKKRSLSIGKWLVAHAIDCKRIYCVGFGSSKPIALNDTPEGRSQNRRVVVVNAELKGKLIGGMPYHGGGDVAGNLCAE